MRIIRIALVGLAALAFAATAAAQADDVTVAIGNAETAYNNGDYQEASTQLQTALVGVNQMLIDMLVEALPDAPPGWTSEDPEGMDATAMGVGFFASLMVSAQYYPPNGSSIELTVAANSPLLATLSMFLANPMMAGMAGQSGMNATTACGYDAMEQFSEGVYDLNVLAGNATLISFSGQSADDVDYILELANATDCAAIVDVVE